MKKLRPGRKLCKLGGHGVERHLYHTKNEPDVFWSKSSNSFVAVKIEHPQRVYGQIEGNGFLIVSINGIGEIRWAHRITDEWMSEDTKAAIAYFFEEDNEASPIETV